MQLYIYFELSPDLQNRSSPNYKNATMNPSNDAVLPANDHETVDNLSKRNFLFQPAAAPLDFSYFHARAARARKSARQLAHIRLLKTKYGQQQSICNERLTRAGENRIKPADW